MATNRITALRKEAGDISKEALAREVGISPKTMGYLEAGTRNPGYAILRRVADVFTRLLGRPVGVDDLYEPPTEATA